MRIGPWLILSVGRSENPRVMAQPAKIIGKMKDMFGNAARVRIKDIGDKQYFQC